MSAFPNGGDIAITRAWLDNAGFCNVFIGWEANALLGKNDDFIRSEFARVQGDTPESLMRAEMLCGYLNMARQTPERVRVSKVVKIYLSKDPVNVLITFNSGERPIETVKEEIRKLNLPKRKTGSLDSYALVTSTNIIVSDFDSIMDQPVLLFCIPDQITPLSGNEWTHVQFDQLKIKFEEVDIYKFFSTAGFTPRFSLNARCSELANRLSDLDYNSFRNYATCVHDYQSDIRTNLLLQHPICKALYAAKKYVKHGSFIDDFVKHLLNEIGFNEGSLYVAPQMQIPLHFGEIEKMAIADYTVIDLLSFAKIGLIQDKIRDDMALEYDPTPQLVAESIAISQRNEALKSSSDVSVTDETVYGIRVKGFYFHFYAIHISNEIRMAMEKKVAATAETIMYRYESDSDIGLDFMIKDEREKIILMLSVLQEVATNVGVGERSPRRSSKLDFK